MPWIVLPVLPLLAYRLPIARFVLDFAWLFVPAAPWLGHRYGRAGLAAAAFGGLFLVPELHTELGFFGGHLDLYLLGLGAGWMAATRRPLDGVADAAAEPWALLVAALVLPFSAVLLRARIDTDWAGPVTLGLGGSLSALFYLAVFLAGLSLGRARRVLTLLVAAAALGLAAMATLDAGAAAASGGPAPLPAWRYGFSRPAALLFAVACFATGRLLRDFGGGRAPGDLGVLGRLFVVLLLLIIWAGGAANEAARAALPPPPALAGALADLVPGPAVLPVAHVLYRLADWLGVGSALALAGFAAGALLGYGGVLAALAAAVGLFFLNAVAFGFRDPTYYDPLPLLAFGVWGVEVAASRWGRSPPRQLPVWIRLVGTALAALGLAAVIADNLEPLRTAWDAARAARIEPDLDAAAALAILAAFYAVLLGVAAAVGLWRLARRLRRDIAALRGAAAR